MVYKIYICDICGLEYKNETEAYQCEKSHTKPEERFNWYKVEEDVPCGANVYLIKAYTCKQAIKLYKEKADPDCERWELSNFDVNKFGIVFNWGWRL